MNLKKQSGLTLIELMVGIVIGLIVVAGGISFYVATIKGSTSTHRITHLTQESGAIMQLITNDIRRAGYGIPPPHVIANFSVFDGNVLKTNIAVPLSGNTDCVLYVYDANDDGDISDADDEHHGFKRIETNGVGRIDMKTNGTSMTDCSAGTWVTLSDDNLIDVTAFTVTNSVTNLTGVDVRLVTLSLDSESQIDSAINKPETIQVYLRNHNFP